MNPGDYQPPPPTVMLESKDEFEVESILMYRTVKTHSNSKNTKIEFLVKWRGFDAQHATWEPQQNCVNCPEVVQQYWDNVSKGVRLQIHGQASCPMLGVKTSERRPRPERLSESEMQLVDEPSKDKQTRIRRSSRKTSH